MEIEEKDSVLTTEKDSMLTTFDNPFNPFTDFIRWWKQDLLLGHDCCGTLAREANISNVSSEKANDIFVVNAMNRIVRNEPTIYKIVYRTDLDEKEETALEG